MDYYRTIKEPCEGYYEEKKSKFICNMYPVKSEEEAKELITMVKKGARDARHHCSAFVINDQQLLERYADDGEPAGTAGMPMLEVLRGSELRNVLAVVTRYFGGVKLGTGGLVRAYTKATQRALEEAIIIEKGVYILYSIKVPYTISGKVEYAIQNDGLYLQYTQYGEEVTFVLCCAKTEFEAIEKKFVELCNNQCILEKQENVIGYIQDGQLMTS